MRTWMTVMAACAVAWPAMGGTGTVKGTVTTTERASRPVADAVVGIEGPSVPAAAGAPHAVVDQKGQKFVPRVLAVVVGTTVDFPNSDPVLHNVNAAFAAEPFDLGLYGQGETKSVTFRVAGVRRLRCNVHPAMEGFLVVHPNPYVAVSDAQGRYTITGVPPGSYEVRVWHESLPERRIPVTVGDGQVVPLDVRLEKDQ